MSKGKTGKAAKGEHGARPRGKPRARAHGGRKQQVHRGGAPLGNRNGVGHGRPRTHGLTAKDSPLYGIPDPTDPGSLDLSDFIAHLRASRGRVLEAEGDGTVSHERALDLLGRCTSAGAKAVLAHAKVSAEARASNADQLVRVRFEMPEDEPPAAEASAETTTTTEPTK